MEAIGGFRELLLTSKLLRCCTRQLRNNSNYSHKSFLQTRFIRKPKNIGEIPDMKRILMQYSGMKITENNLRRALLDELIGECKIDSASMHTYEKIFVIQSSIATLIKTSVIPSVDTVVEGLLSKLDRFPFDRSKLGNNEDELSIGKIRNAIEKQFLAWKYKTKLGDVDEILMRYKLCLYEFRSLGNMMRNIQLLEKMPKASDQCVAEKIYHINQKPFDTEYLENFQETIAGLNWQLFPRYCPKILHHSHRYILFLISTLRDLGFTDVQIQEGLPFFYLTFENLMRRLNHMFSNSEISQYRNEDKFLYLLSYTVPVLKDLVDFRKASFQELIDMIVINSTTLTPKIMMASAKSILYHVKQFYAPSSNSANLLKRHPKHRMVSEKQINDTLTFLKNKNFTVDEVLESVTIVLYPWNLVEKTLLKIDLEADNLKQYGFENGRVPQKTPTFEYGTKEREKILQLCLYYLEKPYHFSGDGIWSCQADSELDSGLSETGL